MLHPTSLGFPVSAASHIYDTDINEAQELRLDVAYCFLIYILRREHAIPF